MKIIQRLNKLLEFIEKNKGFNRELQESYYSFILNGTQNNREAIVRFLYDIAESQSRPSIDHLSIFYRRIHTDLGCCDSMTSFISHLGGEGCSYYELYKVLNSCDGWGGKTSALFTKIIYNIHVNKYCDEMNLWSDAPREFYDSDKLYLPVDKVILNIFKRLDSSRSWTFNSINKLVHENFSVDDIALFDDLWFWGFISQRVEKNIRGRNERVHQWNLDKYWSMKYSNKDSSYIKTLEKKTNEFLKLTKPIKQ